MASKTKKNFYPNHSLQPIQKINKPKALLGQGQQPDFIQFLSIGQSEPVAFLGEEKIDTAKLAGKFIRIDRMVIPEAARLVNPDILAKIISKKKDNKAIDINTKDLLYKEKMQQGVLLNVSGMVENEAYTNMSFHPCDNKKPPFLRLRHSQDGFMTCPKPQLMLNTSETEIRRGEIRHNLVVFHMPYEELIKARGYYHPRGSKKKKANYTIMQILEMYFKDKNLTEHNNPPKKIWREKGALKGGLFLIPMVMPDDRVAYYCLLNVNGKSNRRVPVKKILKNWLAAVKQYNRNQDKQWIGIAGNDGALCFIDEWSIFLGKNAQLLVADKKDVYKKTVLNSAIKN